MHGFLFRLAHVSWWSLYTFFAITTEKQRSLCNDMQWSIDLRSIGCHFRRQKQLNLAAPATCLQITWFRGQMLLKRSNLGKMLGKMSSIREQNQQMCTEKVNSRGLFGPSHQSFDHHRRSNLAEAHSDRLAMSVMTQAVIIGHRSQLELAAVGLAISLANVTGGLDGLAYGIVFMVFSIYVFQIFSIWCWILSYFFPEESDKSSRIQSCDRRGWQPADSGGPSLWCRKL